MKLLKLFLILISCQSTIYAQSVYQVEIPFQSQSEVDDLANYIHIDSINANNISTVLTKDELKDLQNIDGLNPTIVGEVSTAVQSSTGIFSLFDFLADTLEFPTRDADYHTYDEVNVELNKLVKENSKHMQLFELGKSYEGRKQLGVKISYDGFANELSKPALVMFGTHHAREHLSTEVPLLMIQKISDLMKQDVDFRDLMRKRVIYVVPLINPDGAIHDIKDGVYKFWRKNRSKIKDSKHVGVDLNRNYGYKWGTGGSSSNPRSSVYKGEKAFTEPEILSVKKFVESHKNIKTMISFHTYSELILYPWGHSKSKIAKTDDQKAFVEMANQMSKWNNYKPMQASGLYVASGDTCDWAYGEHGVFCFTFELSPTAAKGMFGLGFYPGDEIIQSVVDANIDPVVYLLENTAEPLKVLE